MNPKVALLSTLETKSEETAFLQDCLIAHAIDPVICDLSLRTDGVVLTGAAKMAAMDNAANAAYARLSEVLKNDVQALVGLGGGTGGEIVLRVMRALPIDFPKLLVTTLPFDPRAAVADNFIVLVPTLADICGLNATLRHVLENVAAMTAGLCTSRRERGFPAKTPSIGITALGATEGAIGRLVSTIQARGREATVFHANGYGGAAFSRFAECGAFRAVIDLTPHELTRIMIAGTHVPMPTRFTAAAQADLPQFVLPGGLNFIGLGRIDSVCPIYLDRPHYRHSGYFTHVKLTEDEMARVADQLTDYLNAAPLARLIVPMGGFSHQDAPGGAIEDAELRQVFLHRARARARSHVGIIETPAHIAAPEVTEILTGLLAEHLPEFKDSSHA